MYGDETRSEKDEEENLSKKKKKKKKGTPGKCL